MIQLDPDRFLNELGRLFEKAKAKDTVSVTLKRSERLIRIAVHDLGLCQVLFSAQPLRVLTASMLSAANLKPRKAKKPHLVCACTSDMPCSMRTGVAHLMRAA